jgi:hypothetical protein
VSDLKQENGNLINDNQQKADEFNDFFSSVYTVEDLNSIPGVNDKSSHELTSVSFSQELVLDLLNKLQPDKSPGLDGIHPRVLKECATELQTTLFQTSLTEGRIPEEWKEKKGIKAPGWKL